MTREDINDIINAICPNDEDYEKPCISPKYLRQELEQLALDQRQWNEESTTKNDLGVDCISREQTQTEIEMNASRYTIAKERGGMGQVEWSDQLIKVSDAVDIIRNLPSVTPQEPFINKPCVSSGVCEHDKQKVLEKIRAEIEPTRKMYFDMNDIDWVNGCDYVLSVIDKYKAETEDT